LSGAASFLALAGRRIAASLLLLVGASFLIYFTIRSAPGDAVDAITPMGTPPEIKEKLAAEFGLDQGVLGGYGVWLSRSAMGDFGESLVFAPGQTVMEVAAPAFEKTLLLSSGALFATVVLSILLALLLGEPSARQQGLTGALYFITSAPGFVSAVVFSAAVNAGVQRFVEQAGHETPPWYPIPIYSDSIVPYFFAGFVLVMGDGLLMDTFNAVRAEILSVRGAQFIAAVRARGASVTPHLWLNLAIPIFSAFVSRLPVVLGGVVIVEYVFTLDGAGYLLLEASKQRDFPVVVGLSVLFTLAVIVVGLLSDVARSVIDQREVARDG